MAVSAAPSREAIEAIATEYCAAISRLDEDAYIACFADGAEVHDPEGAPPHIGEAALRAFVGGISALCESCELTPEALHVGGSSVAMPWRVVARGRNGKEATAQGVDVLVVNAQGRIQELHGYWNPEPFIGTLTS